MWFESSPLTSELLNTVVVRRHVHNVLNRVLTRVVKRVVHYTISKIGLQIDILNDLELLMNSAMRRLRQTTRRLKQTFVHGTGTAAQTTLKIRLTGPHFLIFRNVHDSTVHFQSLISYYCSCTIFFNFEDNKFRDFPWFWSFINDVLTTAAKERFLKYMIYELYCTLHSPVKTIRLFPIPR